MEHMSEESVKLKNLFAKSWENTMKEDPVFSTLCGENRYNDRLPAAGIADYQRQLENQRSFLKSLYTIERDRLSSEDRIDYQIFETVTTDQIRELEFKSYLMPLNKVFGFHTFFPQLYNQTPLDTSRDYENYISRLNGFKKYVLQNIELMEAGIRKGYTMPTVAVSGCEKAIKAQIVGNAVESLLYRPFTSFPQKISSREREKLSEAGKNAVVESVIPAYQKLLDFVEREYLPATRNTIGLSSLPNGKEYYRHLMRHYTTTELSPKQVHQVGLDEVRRIRVEMEAILRELKFSGSFSEFVKSLKGDPRFYTDDPGQLLKEVSFILKKMDGELPRMFKTLPRIPYGVKPVPAYMAADSPCAYYMPPAGDGSRAGYYFVNTHDLKNRPLYELESLSLHEAVPGHHLQLALQHELKDIPAFRRFGMFTSFIEGWALYAERLGLEVGFYRQPHNNFARLTYEMWRACRLVVDTGIHYFYWSREKAVDFMLENSALAPSNINVEIDRYIALPGQALAYKIGEIKIRELRSRAEKKLGSKFNLRDFHEVLLGKGSLPLYLLEIEVDAYLSEGE